MMKRFFFFLTVAFISFNSAFGQDRSNIYGHWKGVGMSQDKKSNDGNTFFLPNEGEMILDENSIRIYYYPYFKKAEYQIEYGDGSLFYQIGEKHIKSDYYFNGDTLVFRMQYINKVFVKMYVRTEMNGQVIADLDKFGYRTQKLVHEFELDTFHKDQRKGFFSYDSLNFKPYDFIEFKDNNTLVLNRKDNVTYTKGYKTFSFSYNGIANTVGFEHVNGTQDVYLRPMTQCSCDSIILPYITVTWGDRIRQAIIDEENF